MAKVAVIINEYTSGDRIVDRKTIGAMLQSDLSDEAFIDAAKAKCIELADKTTVSFLDSKLRKVYDGIIVFEMTDIL